MCHHIYQTMVLDRRLLATHRLLAARVRKYFVDVRHRVQLLP